MIMDYAFKIVSGQLILLPKDLPDQLKQDILNTQLYAQLYASVRANKFSDAEVWDKRLTSARSELKWSTHFLLGRRPVPADEAKINVTSLILDQLAHAPHYEPSVMEDAIRRGLRALSYHSPAQAVFFDSVLRVTKSDSLLTTPLVSDVYLNVSVISPKAHMIDVQIGFSVHQLLDEHLFDQSLKGKDLIGAMSLSVSEYELDTSAFSHIRDKVVNGLDGADATQIVNLDLIPEIVITAP